MLMRDSLTERRLWQLPNMTATIDREQLKAKVDRGERFRLVEVVQPAEFKKEHLPGAMNVPLAEFRQRAREEFSIYDQIVVYSGGKDGGSAVFAARVLQEMGHTNVYLYAAGKQDWVEAGYPVEREAPATAMA
jgi:rhodanese-related sulfurtransferase